jgi:hypothetical protein
VNTLFVFLVDLFKLVFLEVFIPFMAIHAGIRWFHSQFTGVRKRFVFIRVTVDTLECTVVGLIEFSAVDDEVGIHPFLYIFFQPVVVIIVLLMPVTFQTGCIIFVIPDLLTGILRCCSCGRA